MASAILFSIVLEIALLLALVKVGIFMVQMRSVAASLQTFEKHAGPASVVEKWFFCWKMPAQRAITKSMLNVFGDRGLTALFKLTGVFFLLVAVLLVGAIIFQIS